jgi:hypothetical protein
VNIPRIWKQASKAAADNAPLILTSIGVAGAITTAVFAGRASFKAAQIIKEEEDKRCIDNQQCLSTQDKIKAVWPQFIPTAVVGACTVTCIIGANHISGKRAAALASAYTVSQKYFEDYKDKVAKKLGEQKAKEVENEIAKDRVLSNPPPAALLQGGFGNHDAWVHENFTDHWFKSSHAAIEQAVIDTNFQIINEGWATLADFLKLLGVTHAAIYEEVGWGPEKKLEVFIGSTKMDDNTLAYTLDFRTEPVRGN